MFINKSFISIDNKKKNANIVLAVQQSYNCIFTHSTFVYTFVHSYSCLSNCYRGKCIHCEEFYKKGIFKNVKKFLERIEKGADTLTEEDIDDDDEDDVENVEENSGKVETIDISVSLAAQIEQIKYW